MSLPNIEFIITFEAYPDEEFLSDGGEQKVMNEIERGLAKDFANEVEYLFSGMVQVRVGPVEHGSILGSVFLVLVKGINVADFFSKYKDFYESLVLLRTQLRALLNRILNRSVPLLVSRTINITFVPGPATRAFPVIQRVSTSTGVTSWYSRTFFIYLIVINIFNDHCIRTSLSCSCGNVFPRAVISRK